MNPLLAVITLISIQFLHIQCLSLSFTNLQNEPSKSSSLDGNKNPNFTSVSGLKKSEEICSSVCINQLNPNQGCDYFRLRERLPHFQYCITGFAKNCSKNFTSYCWNGEDAAGIKGTKSIEPVCNDDGFRCDDITVSTKDLKRMNCYCSVQCEEAC